MSSLFRTLLFSCIAAACAPAWGAVAFQSAHALVVDEATGEVLLEKNSAMAAPIASLTKLMTAMVVLDAHQDPDELIRIDELDLDTLKHTHSGVPVGATLPRRTLLQVALMASDNHAASALARNYPGGQRVFSLAVGQKIAALGLEQTVLVEPTGLSPMNHASAADLVKVLRAASAYPEIGAITSSRRAWVDVNGRTTEVHNTNDFVGKAGWEILLSKTGFTHEAGSCLAMRLQSAGRTVLVVLMGAMHRTSRALDANNVQRWLAGEPTVAPPPAGQLVTRSTPHHGALRVAQGAGKKRATRTRNVQVASS